jgi:FAD/FMN-containing dehydrogenase
METQITPVTDIMIDSLRSGLSGRVLTPTDGEYEKARQTFVGGLDRRPAAIARVADAQDVSRVIALAGDSGVELSVRSGGHNPLGLGVSDGGIMLDLSGMKGLELDLDGRTIWAETGLTAGELSRNLAKDHLAIGLGDTGSVGIGGITTGGGVGYLSRKFGLTIDSVLAAEVVTADGQLRLIDPDHEPDLFWAIRGGGGNFGVATRFKYRLADVGIVVGGMLLLPATPDTWRASFALRAMPLTSCRRSQTSCRRRRCRSSRLSTTASCRSWR